jgi:hypothetical protein
VDLLGAFNLRQHNYLVFGLALLLASLWRTGAVRMLERPEATRDSSF